MQTVNCTARCAAKMVRRVNHNRGKLKRTKSRLPHRTDVARISGTSHPHKCAACGLETDEMCLDVCYACAALTPAQWFLMANDAPDDGKMNVAWGIL